MVQQPSLLENAALWHWLRLALAEDIGRGDVTSQALIAPQQQAALSFRNREPMVVAGIFLIDEVMQMITPDFSSELHVTDGQFVNAPQALVTLRGNARALLSAERLILNLLQRCGGVATLTRKYVQAVAGTGVMILDTRKTMPGMRDLDKYAVTCGGGHNHRMRLDDRILIKDNHIAVCGGVMQAIERAKVANSKKLLIEIECDTLAQVQEVLACGVDWILLDNMPPAMLREAVALVQKRVKLEASGGVNLQTVRAIAETGVDAISVGAITHSAPAVDIGLDIVLN
jgi:nicotinate-nucleotide pyrophosphorylase (carboxylating)